jgi:hypothetical protein
MFRFIYSRYQADYENKEEISTVYGFEFSKFTEPKHFPAATTHAETVLIWQPFSLPTKLMPHL